MSEHSVPAGKLCPELSTAQILVNEIAFQAHAQPGISLRGIRGAPGASSPDVTKGKAVFVHKDPILPEGFDPTKGPIDISQISKFRGQPISVPCIRDRCAKWCEKHDARDCGGGCQECSLEVMTKAFSAAMAKQQLHQENPAASTTPS